MLNLSELERESLNYSFLEKAISLRKPDAYLAENLADYKENVLLLEFPWYKRFPFPEKLMDKAYILFQNVGLKKSNCKEFETSGWFVLHDSSGEEEVYWKLGRKLFPTGDSFEKVRREQGFKENDLIYDIFAKYLMRNNFLSIVKINTSKLLNKDYEGAFDINLVPSF